MNDIMHIVAKVWYRLYWGVILLFGVVVAGGSAAVHFRTEFMALGQVYGLTLTTLIIAAISVVYCLTFYLVLQRNHPSMAMFGASLLFTVVILDGLTLTHGMDGFWVYLGAWFASVFFAGMYGTPIVVGSVFFAAVYVLLEGNFNVTSLSLQQGVMLSGTGVLAIFDYFFWRNKYADPMDTKLSQLTGMLRSKEEQSAILIQSIADGVVVTNTEGKISLMNRTAANMTGWTVDEATGIDVKLVFKAAKENGEEIAEEDYPFKAVLVHKAYFNQVLQLTSRGGKKQVISLVISPVVTSTGEVYGTVAVLRDISEQRAAEQQRGEFISTASHEMRTPVAAIEGYLSLALNEKVSTIDTRARGYLEKAHSSTQHLGQLFQDLLTSAKAEDGRLSNHPVVVEMGSFLEQLVEDLRFGAQKKGLASEFVVGSNEAIDATKSDDSTPSSNRVVKPLYYVYVDPDRVREVITNIFDNAVKYTDAGKVSIGLTGNTDLVQLYIRDTGNGIPAEDIPHLFQKFYRVDNSATRTIGGTGLGLFIARKIIELYQGRVWVESEVGKGSTFFINLPRLSAQKAQDLINAAVSLPPPAPPAAKPPTP